MRILTICANYPPYHSGGYGIRIKNIMDHLSERGYEILVLTTIPEGSKKDDIDQAYPVKRVLHESHAAKFFPKEVFFDLRDVSTLDCTIKRFKPDLIYLGHTYTLTKQLFPSLSTLEIPIVCDEGGNSLKGAWTEHGRWFRFTGDYQPRFEWLSYLKPLVIGIVGLLSGWRIGKDWAWPENLSAIFNSHQNLSYVQGLGVRLQRNQVIHSGIDTEKFIFRKRETLKTPLNIICPGRIEVRKGQLDAVRLITSLKSKDVPAHLVLVGEVSSSEYRQHILEEIEKNNLTDQVSLLPMVSQEELIKLYHQADICFFPSYQEPGLSRIPLEAMACGSIVISYGNEASDEIIRNNENSFLVEAGNLTQVVRLLQTLLTNPAEIERIKMNARDEIEQIYSMPKYIDQIESLLEWLLNQP